MTATLQDVAMITGLPISGEAIVPPPKRADWRQYLTARFGVEIPRTAGGQVQQGVPLKWIDNTFSADQVQYHYSQYSSQPPPTQDTQDTPQTFPYDLRTNPRPREQYTFPSDHIPRHKRGRGR